MAFLDLHHPWFTSARAGLDESGTRGVAEVGGGAETLGLPQRLRPLLVDVGAHGDAAAGAQPPGPAGPAKSERITTPRSARPSAQIQPKAPA